MNDFPEISEMYIDAVISTVSELRLSLYFKRGKNICGVFVSGKKRKKNTSVHRLILRQFFSAELLFESIINENIR